MRAASITQALNQSHRRSNKLVAANPRMVSLLEQASLAARGDARVLITGESGVGKNLVAQHIHAHSARSLGPYMAVNCAGVAELQLESELFGEPGKLQFADGGSLFLDEVGDMSLQMQAMLVRFLENGEIVRSRKPPRAVDVRVIAATHRDLAELASQGRFREDLLYRLRVIHLDVPPLRERSEDIRPIATHFLTGAGRPVTLASDAWLALERYRWPGNVRELKNVIEQVVSLASVDRPVGIQALPEAIQCGQTTAPARERRRQVADDLYQAIVSGGYSFWEHIYPLFLIRDITRHDLRELVRRGLKASRGNYRSLLTLFRIPKTDYKRFMNFLATHECRIDYREFRNQHAEPERFPRLVLPPLEPRKENQESRPKATRKRRSR